MKIQTIKAFIIVLVGSFTAANAQNTDEKLNREMTLEREYDPTVQDANKVNRLPEIKEPQVTKHTIDYSPFTTPADPDKEITLLPSGKAMTEIPYNNRRGYFHFGGGMYMNLNGDLGYHILHDKRTKLTLFASHRSTNGKLKFEEYWGDEKQKAKLSDNLIGLNLNHHFDQGAILRLGAKYNYTAFNYYGYSHNRIPMTSSLPFPVFPDSFDYKTNQVNQLIHVHGGVKSREGTMVGYLADVEYNRFTQKYGWTTNMDGIQENNITINAGANVRFGNENNQLAGVTGKFNIFNYKYPSTMYSLDSSGYQNHIEATITPHYRIQGDGWKAQLGANMMLITGDSSKIFISPNIGIEAEIGDRTLFYASATGEIQSNSAYAISLRNRYVDHMLAITPSRTWLDAMLGIRSGIAPGFWFDLFAGYKVTENEVFFLPAIPGQVHTHDFGSYQGAFQPDASLFRVGASLKYAYQKWVDFSLKGVYNSWSLKKGDSGIEWDDMKPYGRPSIEINADLTIRPITPLALNFGYYLGANRHNYLLLDQNEVKLGNLNDLNFMGTWNFNNTFGAYVKLNNLLFQDQELYYGYPMQNFNAMAGININF